MSGTRFQSESTLYSCLNVIELLAWSRHEIWNLSDCNWTRTQNHWVRKQTLNQPFGQTGPVWPNGWVFVYKLSGSGFESSCSHIQVTITLTTSSPLDFKQLYIFCKFYPIKQTYIFQWILYLPQTFNCVYCILLTTKA